MDRVRTCFSRAVVKVRWRWFCKCVGHPGVYEWRLAAHGLALSLSAPLTGGAVRVLAGALYDCAGLRLSERRRPTIFEGFVICVLFGVPPPPLETR